LIFTKHFKEDIQEKFVNIHLNFYKFTNLVAASV